MKEGSARMHLTVQTKRKSRFSVLKDEPLFSDNSCSPSPLLKKQTSLTQQQNTLYTDLESPSIPDYQIKTLKQSNTKDPRVMTIIKQERIDNELLANVQISHRSFPKSKFNSSETLNSQVTSASEEAQYQQSLNSQTSQPKRHISDENVKVVGGMTLSSAYALKLSKNKECRPVRDTKLQLQLNPKERLLQKRSSILKIKSQEEEKVPPEVHVADMDEQQNRYEKQESFEQSTCFSHLVHLSDLSLSYVSLIEKQSVNNDDNSELKI